jgi:hypothetical protein
MKWALIVLNFKIKKPGADPLFFLIGTNILLLRWNPDEKSERSGPASNRFFVKKDFERRNSGF